ncbi:hypothetical protein GCM10027202_05520 [Microvirgula curvata]|uniref:hypothetical protein n=1 Tax=Microvirgula aerodenitrificans TaxID=57480 RepID=UPI0028E739C2|nr:hypothetical protein [Microvirgula aerodenitrificans]
MDADLATLSARLIAHRTLPRSDKLVRRALMDEVFRQALDERLAQVGLALADNPYAAEVAVCLQPAQHEAVFGQGETWQNNTLELPRDAVALLVVLWALIVLPKRERQHARVEAGRESQHDMFGEGKPIATGDDVSVGVNEEAIYADFGNLLGGRTKFSANLGRLVNLGFIVRRQKLLTEGPLLDTLIDYGQLAPRILEGALSEVLLKRRQDAGL